MPKLKPNAALVSLAERANLLPPRQKEVLKRLGRGESRRQIAKGMHISQHTVDAHCKIIYARLPIPGRLHCVRLTMFMKWD